MNTTEPTPEGSKGIEKFKGKYVRMDRVWELVQDIHKLEDQNADLRAALAELIPIAEHGVGGYMRRCNGTLNWGEQEQKAKSAIERAKRITNGQDKD